MAAPLNHIDDQDRDRAIAGTMSEPDEPMDDSPLAGDIVENPDGSATVHLPEKAQNDTGFMDNLAESFPAAVLNSLAVDLIDLIEKDKDSRSKRDKQYEDGIRRTGLGDDAPGGADFEGASRVVHPVLAEACVDFGAAAMKELCPPAGPVKTALTGLDQGDQKLEVANRKRDLLNELLTTCMSEYYDEKEVMFSQLPLGGSQYEKYWYDADMGRVRMEARFIDTIYLPYAATSFYTSQRRTDHLTLTRMEFERRVASGLYRDISISTEQTPELSSAQQASHKVEGVEEDGYNEDGLRSVYEINLQYSFEDDDKSDGKVASYLVTVDVPTRKVVALYRNWAENDESFGELDWWVENRFIPWRGVYGIGLPHLIGSLSAALTGALRALLDSAHINNTPAAIKLKGARSSGQSVIVSPTEIAEIEAPAGVDDIRKLLMPFPFNPPSAVLFQLLGWLTDAAKGVVSTAEEKIADASNNMPVGTALALIEAGSKVFSAIHARLHKSQAKALQIICRLIHDYPDGKVHAKLLQKYQLTPDVFGEASDIAPVSDPNIFSDAQRYAQWQAVMQMAEDPAVQYNKNALHRRGLELLRWPDIDAVLPPVPKSLTSDPVTENQQAVLTGVQLQAAPQQDHLSHLQEHLRFLLDPMGGAGPLFQGQQLQGILSHCSQHVILMYADQAKAAQPQAHIQAVVQALQAGQPIPQMNPDHLAAVGAEFSAKLHAQGYQQLAQQLQQAAQLMQSKMPPQPMDPVQATYQAAMAETQRQTQADQQNVQIKTADMQSNERLRMAEIQKEEQDAQQTFQREMARIQQDAQETQKQLIVDMQQARNDFAISVEELKQGWVKLQQSQEVLPVQEAPIALETVKVAEQSFDATDPSQQP